MAIRRIDIPSYIVSVKIKESPYTRMLDFEYICEDCGKSFHHFTPSKRPLCEDCEKRVMAIKAKEKKEQEAKNTKRAILKTIKGIISDIQTTPSKDNVIADRNNLVKELEKKYLEIKKEETDETNG